MATTDYTMRNFLTDVAAIEGVDAKVKAFAEAEIAKIDKRNADRKAKNKTALANAPLKEAIVKFVGENPGATAEVIGQALELTTAKVTSLATQLRDAEVLVAEDVKKVNGKGKVKAYRLA